jgi:hypothetical protein
MRRERLMMNITNLLRDKHTTTLDITEVEYSLDASIECLILFTEPELENQMLWEN